MRIIQRDLTFYTNKLLQRGDELHKEYRDHSNKFYRYQEPTRELKLMISEHISKLEAHHRWLVNLLDDNEKMALMNLTKLYKNPELYR
jgi:hypothetical protein